MFFLRENYRHPEFRKGFRDMAGVAPGMEALIPKKEQSLADGKVAVEVRAAEAL